MKGVMIKQKVKNSLRSVKRTVSNMNKKWSNRESFKREVMWISLGENCLADDILSRHNRKSFSSVFSSGRSNIEYILQMERENYKNLLSPHQLRHFPDGQGSVVRSTYYKDCVAQYSPRHMLGFEFSHHDPLNVKEDSRAFKRRISRQLAFRGTKDFVFLYHHRRTEHSNLLQLRSHLQELQALYNINQRHCKIVLFYQNIIDNTAQKSIELISRQGSLMEFVCHTHAVWGGDDIDTFWAKRDDSLFEEMFRVVDGSLENNSTVN